MSPIFFASPEDAPLAASWIRSAVRFAVSSLSNAPLLHELRSGGISVDFSQLPFVYRKKSSPGLTAGSMPDTSSPCSVVAVSFAAAAGVDWDWVEAQAITNARIGRALYMAAHPATAYARAVGAMSRRRARSAWARRDASRRFSATASTPTPPAFASA